MSNSSCTAGNNPAASVAVTTGLSGTYLNTRHPVNCDGNFITKWHFCYYTQNLRDASILNVTLAVWSKGQYETSQFYPKGFTRISIIHNHTLAKVFCVEHSLFREDYLPVSHGDIVGVVIPSVNPIPVIGSGEEQYLEKIPSEVLGDIKTDSLSPTHAVWHVEAVIGK